MLTAKQIVEITESNKSDPTRLVRELIQEATKAGGKDNVTAVT